MANKEEILDYVAHTPANTNTGVLKSLLGNYNNNSYDDPNNLVGLWLLNSDEQEEEEEKYVALINPEGDGSIIKIGNTMFIQAQMKFNPNGQIEGDDEVIGSWELLEETLSIVFNEAAFQGEKYNMAMFLYEWASNHQEK